MRSFQFRVSALVSNLERINKGESATKEAAESANKVHAGNDLAAGDADWGFGVAAFASTACATLGGKLVAITHRNAPVR